MKILIVNTYYYPNMIGGTEQSIKLLAEGLASKGHEIYVLTGDKQESEHEIINGVNIIRLDLMNKNKSKVQKVVRKVCELNNLVIKRKVNKIIEKIRPEVIHTNNLFYISPIIWKIANERKIKVVHTLRDYWGLCPKTSLLDKNAIICKKRNVICDLHTNNYKRFSKNVNIVTAPSNFTLDIYNKEGIFTNIPNIMIPNAIDIDIDKQLKIIKKKKEINDIKIQFLYIGSLHQHKGIEYLIKTFKTISNDSIELKICGDGPLKEFVQRSCKEDSRISYLGTVFSTEKDRILTESDVMIIPSIWYEPFGRVVIEAYKYSLPVIACEIGGIKELLNEEYSIAIKPNSEDELRFAIERLSNRETVKKYIKDSSMLLNRYNINSQIDKFEEVYKFRV